LLPRRLPFCHGAGQVWRLAAARDEFADPEQWQDPHQSGSMEKRINSRVVPAG